MSTFCPTKTSTRDDGNFIRTSIVLGDGSSLDIVDGNGNLLVRLNLSLMRGQGEVLIVDVIDAKHQYEHRQVLAMVNGESRKIVSDGEVLTVELTQGREPRVSSAVDSSQEAK